MANISLNSQFFKHNVYLNPVLQKFSRNNSLQKRSPQISSRSEKPNQSFDITSLNQFSYFPTDQSNLSKLFYKKPSPKKPSRGGKNSQSSLISEDLLPKISRSTPVKKKPSFDSIDYEDHPCTPGRWEHSERVYWKKRKIPGHKTTVVAFEGLLGDFCKKNFWEFKAHDFFLCPAWIQGMCKLARWSFIVVVSSASIENLKFLVEYFAFNKVLVDAVYKKRGDLPRQAFDASQVLADFKINSCLFCSSVGIEAGEVEDRNGSDLVFEPALSLSKRLLTLMCPVNSACVNVFFPNPRAQIHDSAILFTEIVDLLVKVLKVDLAGKMQELADQGIFKKAVFPLEWLVKRSGSCALFLCSGRFLKKRGYTGYTLSHLKTELDLQKFLKKSTM
jgi:hypothetical protein